MDAMKLLKTPLWDNMWDKGAPLRLVLTDRCGIYSLLCFGVIFIGRAVANMFAVFIINEFFWENRV